MKKLMWAVERGAAFYGHPLVFTSEWKNRVAIRHCEGFTHIWGVAGEVGVMIDHAVISLGVKALPPATPTATGEGWCARVGDSVIQYPVRT